MRRDGLLSEKRVGTDDVMILRTRPSVHSFVLSLWAFTANEIEPSSFNVNKVINTLIHKKLEGQGSI